MKKFQTSMNFPESLGPAGAVCHLRDPRGAPYGALNGRRAAARRAESEHAGLVQWALSTAGESESMHSNATTLAQTRAFTAREGLLMSRAPLEAWTGTESGASVAADPSQTVARLRDTGVCRVDGCLSDGAAAASNTCTAA